MCVLHTGTGHAIYWANVTGQVEGILCYCGSASHYYVFVNYESPNVLASFYKASGKHNCYLDIIDELVGSTPSRMSVENEIQIIAILVHVFSLPRTDRNIAIRCPLITRRSVVHAVHIIIPNVFATYGKSDGGHSSRKHERMVPSVCHWKARATDNDVKYNICFGFDSCLFQNATMYLERVLFDFSFNIMVKMYLDRDLFDFVLK